MGCSTLTTGVVGVGGDGSDEGVSDGASPCLSSLSLYTSLPPSPSSWQKVGRRLAFLPTNLTDRFDGGGGSGGGGGTGAVPTREAWCAPLHCINEKFIISTTERCS